MQDRTGLLCWLLVTLLWLGCGWFPSWPDLVAERELLMATDRAFAETSTKEGAAEAFRRYLTESAIQFPEGQSPILGRDAIVQRLKSVENLELDWHPLEAEVSRSADLGYTWGTYTLRWHSSDGSEQTRHGKYLNVWKKQPDGSWRVIIDMGNSNPPPAGSGGPGSGS